MLQIKVYSNLMALIIVLCPFQVMTQEIPKEAENIISPEILEDGRVIFRLYAPHADSVQITSDLLPTVKVNSRFGMVDGPGTADLVKNEIGIWSFTSEPLAPELYSYYFLVDGIRTADPNSPYALRTSSNLTNYFLTNGEEGNPYSVRD
ncbi:MAG: hypothetical protein KDC80_15475, partial [Saprospiraceae bacterium]|nr:hypothetical protein [Saprospiraceae bacterium]